MRQATERIFGSRIRAKVLAWFYMHYDESFFVRQLATILKEDSTNISRELANLEKAGILSSARQGSLKYFKTNKACSLKTAEIPMMMCGRKLRWLFPLQMRV